MEEVKREQEKQELEKQEQAKREQVKQERADKRVNRSKGTIVERTWAKVAAFFILMFGFFAGVLGGIATLYMAGEDYYIEGYEQFVHDRMVSQIWNDVGIMNRYYRVQESAETEIRNFLERDRPSLSIELYEGEELVWSFASEEEKESPYHFVCYTFVMMDEEHATQSVNSQIVAEEKELTYYLYVDPEFPMHDAYWMVERECHFLARYAYLYPTVAVAGVLSVLISFVFLMCSAGHHRGKEGITGGVLSRYPFDLITLLFAGIGVTAMMFIVEMLSYSYNFAEYLFVLAIASLLLVWVVVYLRELALRMKMGDVFRHTLIYSLCKGIGALVRGMPLVINVCIVFVGVAIFELMGVFLTRSTVALVLWMLEKVVFFPVVVYVALMCKRLQKGSEMLAAGELSSQIDTSYMILAFKQHGENLNRIAQGMSVAVEQRLKSERLKTELITNVSHDIKTPLTSIINYANLIGSLIAGEIDTETREFLKSGGVVSDMSDQVEGGIVTETEAQGVITVREREILSEYAEVLLRQSKRLKKLLEDLVEASKATTGNLEVHLQSCEVGVLLTQAVGEYEQRFQEKGLEMIVKQPEERITVMADGRHIWRVFDNLLNNICKYAQENTRVYLTVEIKIQGTVEIIFRNMSKYPLETAGEELKERFVRGDQSRHMEGSGLGLSIASSLVELQGGQMEIVTDGDLFKVIIRLPRTEAPEKQTLEKK
ncbi:MAG: sensor histidine kinase [Candidatus Gastranaerophilales bacterium]|nr:sensor histidine kinase [Candidatus Gastranaerophilales bacterium]